MLTAHGGALNTGRNTYKYFETMKGYSIDAIEVDIWRSRHGLYISHLPAILPKKAIPLSYVFEYVKEQNVKVNCDVKQRGLVKPVLELAKKYDISSNIIFTGAVNLQESLDVNVGELYINKIIPYKIENLEEIKRIIQENKHIAGINLSYKYCSDEFIVRAAELDIPLSIYTVDKEDELKRIIKHGVRNVTTNIIDIAINLIGSE